MPHKFLLDENIEGALWNLLQRHNRSHFPAIGVLRIGDPPELPLGSSDQQILLWSEKNPCIIVSHDVGTLKEHLASHLLAGHHCPGIFLVSRRADFKDVLEILAVAAEYEDPNEWQDLIEYIG